MLTVCLTSFSMFQGTYSLCEALAYCAVRKVPENASATTKKIAQVAITNIREIQNTFSVIDVCFSLGGAAFTVTPFFLDAVTTPLPILMANLVAFSLQGFVAMLSSDSSLIVPSFTQKTSCHLGVRVVHILANAIFLNGCGLLSGVILVSSCASFSFSAYSFYKIRQIKWLKIEKKFDLQNANRAHVYLSQIKQEILTLIPLDLRLPGLQSGRSFYQAVVDSLGIPRSDDSISSRVAEELALLRRPQAGGPAPGIVGKQIDELMTSILQFISEEAIEQRKQRLFSIFDQFLVLDSACRAKALLMRMMEVCSLRIQEVEFEVEAFSLPISENSAVCSICQEQSPDRLICPNGHAIHAQCVQDYINANLEKLLPGPNNRYVLCHQDIYKKTRDTYRVFQKTHHYYSLQVPATHLVSCPECRQSLPFNAYELKGARDIQYGYLIGNKISIAS